jgi:putative intracellular protease/amidase
MALEAERPPSLLVVLSGAHRWTLADGKAHATAFWVEELIEPIRVFRDAGIDVTVATPGGVAPTVDEAGLTPHTSGGVERGSGLRDELDGVLADPVALEDVSPSDYDGVFVPGGHGQVEDLARSPSIGELLLAGGDLNRGSASQPFSVVDGNLVTGQNPASSTSVAQKTVNRLRARAHFLHVVPHQGAWTFKHEHGEPQGTFSTQKQAERAAMEHARSHGDWEVIIHDRRGRIRDSEAVRPST